jgi:hypothetical protein
MNDEFMDSDEMLDDSGEDDVDVASLFKELKQQLTMLERKVDMLISNSKERSFGAVPSRDRQFRNGSGPRPSRPSRPYEHSDRFSRGDDRNRNPRERESSHSHYFDRRKRDATKGAKPKKKPF